MGNETIDLRESESIGVVYKISSEGIVFIFTPGFFPDPYIDQRLTPPENRYALGDFVALKTGEGNIVRSHKKTDPVLRVEADGDRILVETQIAFYPSTGQYAMRVEALTGNAAWSPDFNVVLCEADVISQPRRDHMYTAWVQRLDGQLLLMDQPVFWKVSNKKPPSEPINQFSLSKAPWNKNRPRRSTRRYIPQRPPTELLKQYTRDSFEGVVVRTIDDNAIVWSAAIPISEVLFLFGAREGMVVGHWMRFNCEVAIRAQGNCFLEGKKYEIIAPILPIRQINSTVVAELLLSVPDSSSGVIRHRRDVVTVQSPTLGPIEFPSGIFRDSFYGQTLKIRVIKIPKTCSTGASWRFDEFVCDDICSDEEATVASLSPPSLTGLSRFSQAGTHQHGFQTNGPPTTGSFNYTPPLIPQTVSRDAAFGGQHIGGDEELLGVITNVNGEVVTVWTNKFGDIIWNSRNSSQLNGPVVPVLGRWLSYRNYTIEKAASMSQSIISGVPEPIAPLLPTRVIDGQVQVQTKVREVERCINGVQMALSDDVGRTAVSSGVLLTDPRGIYDFRDVFLVWVVHTSASPAWKVVEVVKMCNASANNAAAEAEDAYSDDDSWSQFEELFGDIIPSINSSATRHSPPVTAISRQLNQRFSNVPLNPCTPSVISQSQPSGRPFGRQPPTTHFTPAFSNYNPSVDQGVLRTAGGFQRMNISESEDSRHMMAMQYSQRAAENDAGRMERDASLVDSFVSAQPRHGFQQDISRASTVQASGREVASNPQRDIDVSSTVNLTEENDPLGPPIFGAVKPVPIHSLLSPPLESSSDGEESPGPQDEPTTSDPNVAALPSFDDCIKRLWRIAQVRRTVATLDTDLYFDLSRHMKERGWRIGDELSDFPL